MISRTPPRCALAALALLLGAVQTAQGQEVHGHGVTRNLEDLQLGPSPGFPACVRGAPQSGDPATGPSVLVGVLESGCTIPWHWHNANEHLMMVSGEALIEMRDGSSHPLRAGGFGLMHSRHIHQFRCTVTCTLFVYSDRPLDIHYVDTEGNAVPLEEALKSTGTPAQERE